jgi:hypothetical protein
MVTEHFVENLTAGKPPVLEAYYIYLALDRKSIVGKVIDVLKKNQFRALAHHIDAHRESVAATQRTLLLYRDLRDHRVDTLRMHGRETAAYGFKEFMARMLQIVLVVGVVHDTLYVALIIAHLHLQPVDISFHNFSRYLPRIYNNKIINIVFIRNL